MHRIARPRTPPPGTESKLYYIDVAHAGDLSYLSAILTWNRIVAPNSDWSVIDTTLANMDLKLWTVDGFGALGQLVDQSISSVDNVEHLYEPNGLAPGRYALEVTSDTAGYNYALAWNAQMVPEPATASLLLAAGALLLRRRRA